MKNIDLVENGLTLFKDNQNPTTAVSDTTLLQRYDPDNSKFHAYLMAERLPTAASEQNDILQLYRKMEAVFDISELQKLCFELNVEYENLSGQIKTDKVRELIKYMQRRRQLPDLVQRCHELRPNEHWDLATIKQSETAVQPKLDIAVVIDIARPALRNVAAYLDDNGKEVNFVVLRHQQPGQFLDANDDWSQLAITFGSVMDRIKRDFNGAKIHFFMAGPGALLFAMGNIWGTVDEANVYHYESSTYHLVLPITRQLRKLAAGWT